MEEFKQELSSLELYLTKSLNMVEIRGKRGRKVPLLIPEEAQDALAFLVNEKVRKELNPHTRSYIFTNFGNYASLQYTHLY